jgi:hypothetical protein
MGTVTRALVVIVSAPASASGGSTPTDAIHRTTAIHRTPTVDGPTAAHAHAWGGDEASRRRNNTTRNAALRHTAGRAVDHRMGGSGVKSRGGDEGGDGKSRKYEQTHGRFLC